MSKPNEGIRDILTKVKKQYQDTMHTKDSKEHGYYAGLCSCADRTLGFKDYSVFMTYLRDNKPWSWTTKHPSFDYLWKKRMIAPRIAWLNKHIKKNTKK